jgi:hypothetical protein
VAINREFYKKTENSKVFLTFLLTVVMEGLKDKYSLHLQTEGKVQLCYTRRYVPLRLTNTHVIHLAGWRIA